MAFDLHQVSYPCNCEYFVRSCILQDHVPEAMMLEMSPAPWPPSGLTIVMIVQTHMVHKTGFCCIRYGSRCGLEDGLLGGFFFFFGPGLRHSPHTHNSPRLPLPTALSHYYFLKPFRAIQSSRTLNVFTSSMWGYGEMGHPWGEEVSIPVETQFWALYYYWKWNDFHMINP